MKKVEQKKGFVLLIVIVLISAVLVVGLSIFDIILRELLFSSLGRESLKAFYAADSGAECARYLDLEKNYFDSESYGGEKCADNDIFGVMDSASTTIFTINFNNGACAEVFVNKNSETIPTGYKIIIRSRGYNMDCDSDSPKKVERGVGLVY